MTKREVAQMEEFETFRARLIEKVRDFHNMSPIEVYTTVSEAVFMFCRITAQEMKAQDFNGYADEYGELARIAVYYAGLRYYNQEVRPDLPSQAQITWPNQWEEENCLFDMPNLNCLTEKFRWEEDD